jgi:hypothetical protein
MGQPNIFKHGLREGGTDLWKWAKGHILATGISLLASLCGMPAYLVLEGATMTALQEQMTVLAAYSLIGPTILIAFAYVYFCLRAPYKLYARRINELRDLRVRLGEPIDDLEDSPPSPNRVRRIFAKYTYPVIVGLLLFTSVLFFFVIGRIGQAYRVNSLVVKVYEKEIPIAFLLLQSLADNAVKICDDNKIASKDCAGFRSLAKELHTHGKPYHGSFLPKSFQGKIPPLP